MATTSAETPKAIPLRLIAGLRLKWLRDVPDYLPADGWTLKLSMTRAGQAPINLTASDNGDGTHLFDVAIATSQAWEPGEYQYQEWAEDAGPTERYMVATGVVEVCPFFQDEEQGYDWRSRIKRTLDALDALIEGKADKDQLSYSFAGRSASRMTPDELIKWRNHYRSLWDEEQRKERLRQGRSGGVRVLARFLR